MEKRHLLIYLIIAVAFPITMLEVLGFDISPLYPILDEIRSKLPF